MLLNFLHPSTLVVKHVEGFLLQKPNITQFILYCFNTQQLSLWQFFVWLQLTSDLAHRTQHCAQDHKLTPADETVRFACEMAAQEKAKGAGMSDLEFEYVRPAEDTN